MTPSPRDGADVGNRSWLVDEDDAQERLDRMLSERFPDWSRSRLQEWIAAGQILVDGKVRKPSHKLLGGERLEVLEWPVAVLAPSHVTPQDIPLSVVYQDDWIAVIDKPAGLTVHPGTGCPDGTLANALAFHFKELSGVNGPLRPGIVHRLDRDTSGLLVVALRDEAHRHLAAQLADKSLGRTYHALTWGQVEEERIDGPIGRHPTDRVRMAVLKGGRAAATKVKALRQGAPVSLVECRLETGRTHQIRVHLAWRGHPVVGDPVYGGATEKLSAIAPMEKAKARSILACLNRQGLHARELRLIHPGTGKEMRFESPWPADFAAAVAEAFPGGVALA
jgi:23S rRNA pseudouridine1911/1915/1917 synthase